MKPCGKSRDPLALDIARDLEKRFSELGLEIDVDVDDVEATVVAKVRAAGQDEAAMASFIDDYSNNMMQRIIQTIQVWEAAAAQPEDWRDPAAMQRKKAAAIRHEVKARADGLGRSGARNPVARALKEAAERWGHASGPSLGRWLRRNP